MIYVGIDIACDKHDCCILSEKQTILKQFVIQNSALGYDHLLKTMQSFAPAEETRIGLESTGVYGINLTAFLRRKGYETRTFNPLLIKKSIQATTLRKTKTDKSDAKYLALYLTQALTQPDIEISYHTMELKSLCRQRFSLVQQRSKSKTMVKSILAQVFPEYKDVFTDVLGTTASIILKKYPSAESVSRARVSTLTELIKEASRGRLGKGKAEALHKLAKESVGNSSDALELELKLHLDQIELLNKYIKEYEDKIQKVLEEMNSPITTIPGIGLVLGAMIVGEIGDITRFRTPAKLLAYAGLDPSIRQSGKSVSGVGSMVKHGSKYLRWALGYAARCVAQYNKVFISYMQSKLNEGKHYNVACSHTAKKLVRVIFSILKNNTPYSYDYAEKTA